MRLHQAGCKLGDSTGTRSLKRVNRLPEKEPPQIAGFPPPLPLRGISV